MSHASCREGAGPGKVGGWCPVQWGPMYHGQVHGDPRGQRDWLTNIHDWKHCFCIGESLKPSIVRDNQSHWTGRPNHNESYSLNSYTPSKHHSVISIATHCKRIRLAVIWHVVKLSRLSWKFLTASFFLSHSTHSHNFILHKCDFWTLNSDGSRISEKGRRPKSECTNLLSGNIFTKSYMKMKELYWRLSHVQAPPSTLDQPLDKKSTTNITDSSQTEFIFTNFCTASLR